MRHLRLLLDQSALAEASPTVKVVDLTQGLASPMVIDEYLDLARLDDVHLVARLPLVAVSRKQ